jgi:PhnB protein
MRQLDPYLTFGGNCADAMRFYERTLDGKVEMMMTFADSPMKEQVPPDAATRVMHARLRLGDRVVMASDSMPGQPWEGIRNVHLALMFDDVAEGRRVFDALAAGGQVTMPLQKTFFAEGFGMLVDRYGVPWMVNAGAQSAP